MRNFKNIALFGLLTNVIFSMEKAPVQENGAAIAVAVVEIPRASTAKGDEKQLVGRKKRKIFNDEATADLEIAVYYHNVKNVKKWLKKGANPDAISSNTDLLPLNLYHNFSPMITLATRQYFTEKLYRHEILQIIESLLQYGANIHIRDINNQSAIMIASENSVDELSGAPNNIIQLLIKYEANIQDSYILTDAAGGTMSVPIFLQICGSEERNVATLQYLLDNGASLNGAAQDFLTPLVYAASLGRVETVAFLLKQAGIDIYCNDDYSHNPFMKLCKLYEYSPDQNGSYQSMILLADRGHDELLDIHDEAGNSARKDLLASHHLSSKQIAELILAAQPGFILK